MNYDGFVVKYTQLINYVGTGSSVKIVCLPFWHNTEKNQAITKVALNTHSYLVDLSHLGNGLDVRNYANHEREYKQQGVGKHPGDFGMENISDNIFTVLMRWWDNHCKTKWEVALLCCLDGENCWYTVIYSFFIVFFVVILILFLRLSKAKVLVCQEKGK